MYLLNYAVYKPPDSWKSTHKGFLDNSVSCKVRDELNSPHWLPTWSLLSMHAPVGSCLRHSITDMQCVRC